VGAGHHRGCEAVGGEAAPAATIAHDLIRQATKAGLSVTAIRPDGTLITGKPDEGPANGIELDDAAPIDRSDWN
jgi:hypothetical protein